MREFFTDKYFILSKVELGLKIISCIAFFFFFFPLIILPFFNHASADDYYYGIQFYKEGFLHYQEFIYNNWSGRYSATFIGSIFFQNHFLYNHYYLHTLIFLGLNFLLSFFVIRSIAKNIVKQKVKRNKIFLATGIFTALTIVCTPETSGLLFWFSSSLIYYSGLIFLQLELLVLTGIYFSHGRRIAYILLPVLICVINGFSEVFVLMQLLILIISFKLGLFKKTGNIYFIIVLLLFVVSALFSFLAPGNFVRDNQMPPVKIPNAIASYSYGCLQVLLDVFKSPAIWFVLVVLFLSGHSNRLHFSSRIIKNIPANLVFFLIGIIAFVLLAIAIGVLGLKGSIVPDRFINLVCWFFVFMLCIAAFFIGVITKADITLLGSYSKEANIVCYTALIFCLCFSDYTITAYKSILSAPLYNDVLNAREKTFRQASGNNTVVKIDSYDLALKKVLNKKHPNGSITYYKWAIQKPMLIYNDNGITDDSSIHTLKLFYRIDSVIVYK